LQGALKMQMQSLAAFSQVGDRRGASATLNNLGNLYVEKGDLSEARKYYDQSLAMIREIDFRRGEPYAMSGIGDTLLAQDDLAGAKKQYEQAQALCKEMNDEDFAAQLNAGLASIALAEKRYADGEALAQESVAAYEKSHNVGNQAWAEAILARNLLGAGDLKAAQAAVDKPLSLSRQTTGQTPRYEAALADARLKAKSGKALEAFKELESTLASTQKFGYRLYELQVRLAMGEIELRSGAASARTHLAALETDAKAQGALLVAAQADALLAEKEPTAVVQPKNKLTEAIQSGRPFTYS